VLESRDTDVWLKAGEAELKVDRRALDSHPGIENRMNEELVIGMRPHAMESSEIAGAAPGRTITAVIEATEVLGAETFVHFSGKRPPVITPDIEELLADTGETAESLGDTSHYIARVSPDADVARGDSIDLIVDTSKLHFFDGSTGTRIGAKLEAYS
jgi:multiple sugar transport system ATP-binding protein